MRKERTPKETRFSTIQIYQIEKKERWYFIVPTMNIS